MKKDKIYIVIAIIFAVFLLIGAIIFNKDEEAIEKKVNDATSFISEYEGLNDEELYGHDVLDLNLNKDTVVYVTKIEDILDILKNEDALVYFGFSSCPWCRNMINVLFDAAASKNEPIYYVDIKEIRNVYKVVDGEISETVKGNDSYYEAVEFLKDSLGDYIVYDEEKNEYNTNTKRIYGPTVVTVKEGSVQDIFIGTHADVIDPYSPMTSEQYSELSKEFSNMINDLQNNACGIGNC